MGSAGGDCRQSAFFGCSLNLKVIKVIDSNQLKRPNLLRDAIKLKFYPFAEGAGFERISGRGGQFVNFRREVGDVVQIFDIQWGKYGRDFFVINFRKCLVGEDEEACKLCRLQGRTSGSMSNWFTLRRPVLDAIVSWRLKYTAYEVVEQLVGWFQEVEAWWASGELGPHIYAPLNKTK